MDSRHEMSRRDFLSGVAATPLLLTRARVSPGLASEDPPVITKRVEKLYTVPGCRQPNDLQFTSEGLWILDQVDQPGNKVFLVKPETGAVIREFMTESIHGSGITYGNGALWITSTKMKNPKDAPVTLKVDPDTGKTLKSWRTPGSGYYGRMKPETDTPSGGHGLKWVDSKYWMAVPAAGRVYLMEPDTGEIIRSIPGPGSTPRTHGIAWDNGSLWVINSDDRAIYKLEPADGRILAKIQVATNDPEPHGLDIDSRGVLWYCDAGRTSLICKLA
jgi:streptogramin lyase